LPVVRSFERVNGVFHEVLNDTFHP
jgi:hypothetical protein